MSHMVVGRPPPLKLLSCRLTKIWGRRCCTCWSKQLASEHAWHFVSNRQRTEGNVARRNDQEATTRFPSHPSWTRSDTPLEAKVGQKLSHFSNAFFNVFLTSFSGLFWGPFFLQNWKIGVLKICISPETSLKNWASGVKLGLSKSSQKIT